MFSVFGRRWRGEGDFWIGLIASTLVLPVAAFLIVVAVMNQVQSPYMPPYHRMALGSAAMLMLAIVAIWQFVGAWRAAGTEKSATRWRLTRWMTRALAIGVAGLSLALVSTWPKSISRLLDTALDRDPIARGGHNISVQGDRLLIGGYLGWGMLDKIDAALTTNPGIRRIVLNSPGGHVGVARKLHAVFRARGFDTFVDQMCSSACTVVFAGGQRRILRRGGRLGFHAVDSDNPQIVKLSQELENAFWRDAGLPPALIARINQTPPQSVWYPTPDELLAVRLVTELAR